MNNIISNEQGLALQADINFNNVLKTRQIGEKLISAHVKPNIIIDFSEVSHSDSSGLALLTAWARSAKRNNKKIQFVNLPQSLQRMLKLCGLDQQLPVETSPSQPINNFSKLTNGMNNG